MFVKKLRILSILISQMLDLVGFMLVVLMDVFSATCAPCSLVTRPVVWSGFKVQR